MLKALWIVMRKIGINNLKNKTTMEEQLITYETAKLASEKRFYPIYYEFEKVPEEMYYEAEDFRRYRYSFLNGKSEKDTELVLPAIYKRKNLNYNFVCYAPTQSLLQKWLRENHEIHIEIIPDESDPKSIWHTIVYPLFCMKEPSNEGAFDTYEDALEKGLQEALKLII